MKKIVLSALAIATFFIWSCTNDAATSDNNATASESQTLGGQSAVQD
ncbi:MAG: hypothetical protein ICV81_20880, partial [Flavisolibacter sp.]|nr:hypothetical protein [Flavisolibacter sp.]